jgi:ankyrin repeat protein
MKKFDRDEPNNNLNADNDSILILDIFVAVGNGHIEEARSLIALFGQEEAKKLLNNIRDNTGNTILQMAYKPEMFNYILAQGVNINITNKYGRTLLYDAIEGDDISQIELLLSEGAEINIQDKHGNAPLNFAIVHMKSISTELLLKAGAIANIKNKSDQTPIECLFQTIKYKSLMLSEASNIVRVLRPLS